MRLVAGIALAAAVAASVATTAFGAAAPRSVTSEAGGTSATLTWNEETGRGGGAASNIELALHRNGSGAVLVVPVRSTYCSPCGVESFPGHPPLAVAELEGHGRPAVVVWLTTGGAHCCSVVQFNVTSADLPSTYRTVERNFGDPGMRIGPRGADGYSELISADDRFAYEFAAYAFSGLPIQIFELHESKSAGTTFVDVTRRYPAAVAADAARWLRAFKNERRHALGNGLIAAWAADEELLGHDGRVRATLAREARYGRLRSREHYGPSGKAFVRALLRFLARTGYRR